jgi:hypothetical protein
MTANPLNYGQTDDDYVQTDDDMRRELEEIMERARRAKPAEPFPACTAPLSREPGTSYLVGAWGKRDEDYEEDDKYTLFDISVTTEAARAYHKAHSQWDCSRPDEPYEGDHTPAVPISEVHQWCVENAIFYEPRIEPWLMVPTLRIIMSESQFKRFADQYGLLPNPDDDAED